jgi:hypothetical protein
MGCDIHMYVEYKTKNNINREWRCGDCFRVDNPFAEKPIIKRVDLYDERDYSLFAVLADVKNSNFFEYIAEPKGLPDDVTEYVRQEYTAWGVDAHSCSYFTLRELIEYHDEHKPKDALGYYILKPLIDRLKRRADELDLIWDFEWNNSLIGNVAHQKADNIRIVFWFDN